MLCNTLAKWPTFKWNQTNLHSIENMSCLVDKRKWKMSTKQQMKWIKRSLKSSHTYYYLVMSQKEEEDVKKRRSGTFYSQKFILNIIWGPKLWSTNEIGMLTLIWKQMVKARTWTSSNSANRSFVFSHMIWWYSQCILVTALILNIVQHDVCVCVCVA